MADKLLRKAIEKVQGRHPPQKTSPTVYVPIEEYRALYDMLEVWDKNRTDEDIQNKTKFIYETLSNKGNPKDLLINIFSKLGATSVSEDKVTKVYHYLKLRHQSEKTLQQYENIQKDINALGENNALRRE